MRAGFDGSTGIKLQKALLVGHKNAGRLAVGKRTSVLSPDQHTLLTADVRQTH